MGFEDFLNDNDALFHYTKLSTCIEKILPKKQLRLSSLKDTNDPREYKFSYLSSIGRKAPKGKEEYYDQCYPIFDRIVKHECRIICFCSNAKPVITDDCGEIINDLVPTVEGWAKSRMWSQYGESQNGVCLVFSKSSLLKYLDRISDIHSHRKKGAFVKYTPKGVPHDAYQVNSDLLYEKGVQEYCEMHLERHIEDLFFTKHIDYRDESEFRIVLHDPKKKFEFISIENAIKGLVLGDRTPEVYNSVFEQFSNNLNIGVLKAYWFKGKPNLIRI